MRHTRLVLATLSALALAPGARAQDAQDNEAPRDRDEPRYHIQVLQNPYDIASFYRSHDLGRAAFAGDSGAAYAPGPYDIANYYRQGVSGGRYGYSRFWSNGYGLGRTAPSGSWGYRRSIGQNGDLYLFAPTILAPIGPLTGVFYDER